MLRLLDYLQPEPDARMLDLACGKGRHALFLANRGYEVVGLDLSFQSIAFAQQFETDKLSFFRHDMRLPFRSNYFDYIFNFFTSFGYFQNERDDISTLRCAANGLKKEGVFVLDFFNAQYVRSHLVPEEIKVIDDTVFFLNRSIEGNRVNKQIHFRAGGEDYYFEESVRLFTLPEFQKLSAKAGLQIVDTFGDYRLEAFDKTKSPRLILVMRKA